MQHRVLQRQLRKLGLDAGAPPDAAAWQRFLDRVGHTYEEADQDRYLLERSLAISSREMQQLYEQLVETSESRITAERDKLRAVISSLGAGLCTLDAAGCVLSINPEGERLLGCTEADVLGRCLFQLTSQTWNTAGTTLCCGASINALIEAGTPYCSDEGGFARKDGSTFPVSFTLNPIREDGVLRGAVLVFFDVTERKRAEEALRRANEVLEERVAARTADLSDAYQQLLVELAERKQAERQIRRQATLLDHAQDAICVFDATECITYWNKSAERLYGWMRDEALGQQAGPFLFSTANGQFRQARDRVVAEGEWTGELKQVTKDGAGLTVQSRWTYVRGADADTGSVLIVNTDITERKALEMQFLRAQRMESLGTLAGGIAHDLNNILGPILMSAQMLQRRLTDARSRKLLGTMEKSAQRGADLVRQVLAFARGARGERASVPVAPLVAELARIVQDTFPRSIEIRLDVADEVGTVEGDATQLHQVLMNLCLNARDAMPEGGTLRIATENVALEDHYARLHVDARPGRYVLLSVGDTGLGMAPAVQDKIFEPFFTTKEKGTGLGLSTALGIVAGHGGFINVYSEAGHGTSFKVFLPASEKTWAQPACQPDAGLRRGSGELILVVDDERPFRDITQQLLEEHGYRALTACDGAEALDLYRQYQDQVRLVITDIMMPTMDGRALIKALYTLNPAIKIVAASGLSTNENLVEKTGVAVQAFLPKPYETAKLLGTLGVLLNGTDPVGAVPSQ